MVCCGKTSSRSPRAVDSAWAWLVCACASVSNGLVHGVVLSFGVMLPVLMDEFNDTKEKTALVGSLAIGVALFTSIIGGRLIDWLGFKCVNLLGSLTCAASLTLSSWATSNLYLYFSYGVVYGLGMTAVYMSSFLVVARYFVRQRCFAIGFVASGAAVGVFVLGPSQQALVETVGWRNTYRILSGVFVLSSLMSLSFDPNVEEEPVVEVERCREITVETRRRKVIDFSVCAFPGYVASVLSMSLIGFGHFSLPIHLVRHCEELGFSGKQASYLFLGIGLCSLVTRLVVGKICDLYRVNPRYLNQLSAVCSGVVTILVTLRVDYYVLIVLILFYGAADGTYNITYSAITLNSVTPEQRSYALGYASMALSVCLASGPAITGLVADKSSYTYAFYMSGAVTLFGAAIPLSLCCVREKSRRRSLVELNQPRNCHCNSQLVINEWISVL